MATNLVAKMVQNYLPPALIALPFRNESDLHTDDGFVPYFPILLRDVSMATK